MQCCDKKKLRKTNEKKKPKEKRSYPKMAIKQMRQIQKERSKKPTFA